MTYAVKRRGIVLMPSDFSLDWVSRMKASGLNLLGFHMSQSANDLLPFLASDKGRAVLAAAREAGVDVEYEIHALSLLLPRGEFESHPDWFRMDMRGARVADGNLCPANERAMDIVRRNVRELAARLAPTTNRYFFWPDDGKLWCHCPACQGLSDSDQNVLVMNAILSALREVNPKATLACLSYHNTLAPPESVRPDKGLFLEWAPIGRCYRHAICDPKCSVNRHHLAGLMDMLNVFDPSEAQALEYWMDASMFSRWKRPSVRLPFLKEVMERDVEHYRSLGIRSITSFGCYLDEDYVKMHGEPPIGEYGSLLSGAAG